MANNIVITEVGIVYMKITFSEEGTEYKNVDSENILIIPFSFHIIVLDDISLVEISVKNSVRNFETVISKAEDETSLLKKRNNNIGFPIQISDYEHNKNLKLVVRDITKKDSLESLKLTFKYKIGADYHIINYIIENNDKPDINDDVIIRKAHSLTAKQRISVICIFLLFAMSETIFFMTMKSNDYFLLNFLRQIPVFYAYLLASLGINRELFCIKKNYFDSLFERITNFFMLPGLYIKAKILRAFNRSLVLTLITSLTAITILTTIYNIPCKLPKDIPEPMVFSIENRVLDKEKTFPFGLVHKLKLSIETSGSDKIIPVSKLEGIISWGRSGLQYSDFIDVPFSLDNKEYTFIEIQEKSMSNPMFTSIYQSLTRGIPIQQFEGIQKYIPETRTFKFESVIASVELDGFRLWRAKFIASCQPNFVSNNSIRHYVNVYSSIVEQSLKTTPLLIDEDKIYDYYLTLYNDRILNKGSTLEYRNVLLEDLSQIIGLYEISSKEFGIMIPPDRFSNYSSGLSMLLKETGLTPDTLDYNAIQIYFEFLLCMRNVLGDNSPYLHKQESSLFLSSSEEIQLRYLKAIINTDQKITSEVKSYFMRDDILSKLQYKKEEIRTMISIENGDDVNGFLNYLQQKIEYSNTHNVSYSSSYPPTTLMEIDINLSESILDNKIVK